MPSKTVLFGLSILDILKEKCGKKSAEDIKKEWNIPADKVVVAIGYNGIPEQQHIAVLNAIREMDDETKKKIFLLLQMTYGDGGTEEYHEQVLAVAGMTGCEYMGIRHFLTDEEVADVRIMTDIFINAQTTDAFSGSVCENLFAGTLLLNAEWLRYQEFKEHDFKYMEFADIGEIGELIKSALEQRMDVSGNRELIWKMRSWECCAPKWEKVFHYVAGQRRRK